MHKVIVDTAVAAKTLAKNCNRQPKYTSFIDLPGFPGIGEAAVQENIYQEFVYRLKNIKRKRLLLC